MRRSDFAFGEGDGVRVIDVIEMNKRTDGDHAGIENGRRSPTGIALGAEMPKVGNPGVDGDDVDVAFPAESADGETLVIHGGERVGKAGLMKVGLGAEGERLQIHFDAAIEGAFESADVKIRHDELLSGDFVIAPRTEAGCVEPLVGQLDVVSGVMATTGPLVGGIASSTGKIGDAIGDETLANDGANVGER